MLLFQDHNSIGNYNYNSQIYDPCEWDYHFHKNYELVYVMEGELDATVDGKQFCMKQNDFSLILPYNIHAFHTPVHAKVWIGVFSADFVSSFDLFMRDKINEMPTFHVEELLMPFLREKLLNTKTADLFTMKSMIYAVCAQYVEKGHFCSKPKENDVPIQIFKYIEENFKDNISLKTMAAALGYDYHYMSRAYHQIFPANFRRFLNQYRLEYAQELIIHTSLPLTEIALESGFGSVRTFNRTFIHTYGISPKDFKKQNCLTLPKPLKAITI